ncbi:MAG: DUF3450 domain-containing protein [Deltaproteobacteria bacterium]|nr:DUF3450 domain-containing protein [Deltaproteobacteria bacterium]
MKFKKKHIISVCQACAVLGLWSFFSFPLPGWCGQNTAKKVKQPVAQSIQTRREIQKKRDQWEQEKTKLVHLYNRLKQEHEILVSENRELTEAETGKEALIQSLLKQKQESLRIQKEMLPFLKKIYARLETLVATDPPFLKKERSTRLKTLDKVLNDLETSMAEKYRKVMEALFIEAEYGATIEVYQDKVIIKKEAVLGNIFRLGRVSLFFLSLDRQSCAYYNVVRKQWLPLADDYLPAIRSAVEIGTKRRPVGLLSLPLGRLAKQRGKQ